MAPKVPTIRVWLSLVVAAAFGLAIFRFLYGLGASTNLNDGFPWGLWIGFDMLSGVALASGGFVLAGVVHIFGLKKYEPFVRPAIVTALLGYLLAIIGLVMDLGRPWAIWHPLVMWQPHSVMFEVAWCVMLYTTVLFLEFLPIVFERFDMQRALRAISRVTVVFIIVGIVLSTMHQSSLGSLFVMMEHRLHALWFTPMLPVLFFVSAVAVGLAMVIFEALLSGLIFSHRYPTRLLGDLAKALPPILGLYIGLKLADLNARGALGRLFDNSLESWAFFLEIVLGAFLPGTLLLSARVRYDRVKLFGCALLVILGVVMNRLNVCLVGMLATSPHGYLPSWTEIVVTAGIIAGGLLILSLMNQSLPIARPTHDTGRPSTGLAT
jgi:Ni/Fe-hydrogenase subunit HybB-like protein